MAGLQRIGITLGDPAGIGPEIVRAALADERLAARAAWRVYGPGFLRWEGVEWVDTGPSNGPAPWCVGRAQEVSGRAALDALRAAAQDAQDGELDALVTAPVCKEALHLAGERVEGQTQLFERWSGADGVTMLAVARRLRVQVLTRHLPLRAALDRVTSASVEEGLGRLHAGLLQLGFEHPRLALAGLNPHAGEAGLLGKEDGRELEPAVAAVRARGIDVAGPLPPDTVFLHAARGAYDAVLALYHDQGFIPVKLHAPEEAFTVLLGLPYLRLSPAHGTAFDIAGRGQADASSMIATLEQAREWARARARLGERERAVHQR